MVSIGFLVLGVIVLVVIISVAVWYYQKNKKEKW